MRPARGNGACNQELHRRIALIEIGGQQFHSAVAIQPQRQLREVVGTDGKAVEILEELFGQNRIARYFAHHDVAQAVVTALESLARQQFADLARLLQRPHERHHHLHIGQPHVVAHALHGLALHGKRFGKVGAHIAGCAPESEHGVFFFRLVAAAADELAVFVALEVRQAHDHGLGPERCRNGGHTFGDLVHIEGTGTRMAARHAFHGFFQIGIDIGVVEDGLGVYANIVVDDEFQPRQAHAVVGQLAEVESQLRVADVHHDLERNLRHLAPLHLGHFGFEQAVVNAAGVAFGAAHRHQRTVLEPSGGVATTHYGRNAQFARNDGGVAGAAPAVGNDGRGFFHDWLPVGVGHVGDQHVACLHLVHFTEASHQPNRAGADFLPDRPAFCQHGALALEPVAVLHLAFGLAFHRLWPRLQNVELAVGAILAPFDVHRAAIMLFDHQGVTGQLLHLVVSQRIAVALFRRHIDGLDQLAVLRLFLGRCKHHLQQLAPQIAADQRLVACFQHGLVHIELVGVDGALHHRFTQSVAGRDEDHVAKARFGIHREHHARSAQVGAHHALHPGRKRHVGMGEALVHAIADGAVVVQRGEHFLDLVQHLLDAHNIEKGFLLAGKRGIGQIFCRGGGAHGEAGLRVAAIEGREGFADGLFQIFRERLLFHECADFGACGCQRIHVVGVQRIELGLDSGVQPVVFQELTKSMCRRGKAGGHTHPLRQLRDHLAQAGVLAAHGLDVAHAKFFKRCDQIGRRKQCGHDMLQK